MLCPNEVVLFENGLLDKAIGCVRVFILLLFLPNLSFSQIAITSEDFLGQIGATQIVLEDTRSNITVDVGSPGANQVWDFRNMVLSDPIVIVSEFLSPNQTVSAATFPEANFVEKISIPAEPGFAIFQFYNFTNSDFINLGDSIFVSSMGIDTSFVSFQNDTIAPLPVAFGNTWMAFERDTTGLFPTIYSVSIDTTMNTIDGWGTVRLPLGDFQCLRLKQEGKLIEMSFVNGVLISTNTETFIAYNWIGRESFQLLNIQSQDGETNPNFTDARWFGRLDSISTSLPSAPTNLVATAVSKSHIILSWTDRSDDENGFRIDRQSGTGAAFQEIASTGANDTTYQDDGLNTNIEYCYRLRAFNHGGNSAFSNEACAIIPPPPIAPSSLMATALSHSQISLQWKDDSDNEDGFGILRKLSISGVFQLIDSVSTNETTYQDKDLNPNTQHCYRVFSFNVFVSSDTSISNEACATTLLTSVDELASFPKDITLDQNFPNPFNPSTMIRYSLPKAERVILKIYSILGKEIVTLVDDKAKKVGYHLTIWDGRNYNGYEVAGGLYFVHMRAGKFVQTRKMLFVK